MSGILLIIPPKPHAEANATALINLLTGTFSAIKRAPHRPDEAERALKDADIALVLTDANWTDDITANADTARIISYALSVPGLPLLHVPLDGAKLAVDSLPPDFPPQLRAVAYLDAVPVHLADESQKMTSVAHLAREMAEVLENTSDHFEALVLSPTIRKEASRRRRRLPINFIMLFGIIIGGVLMLAIAQAGDRPLPGTFPLAEQAEEATPDAAMPEWFIGFVADLSGANADSGGAMLDAVQDVLAERSTLTVNGVTAEVGLLVQDSRCSGSGGGNAAELFALGEDVVGVIGDQCNIGCTVALPLYQAAGLPAISPACTAPELTLNPSGTFNRVIAPTTAEAVAVADYLLALVGADGVALVYDEQQHARQFAPVFEAAYTAGGGQIAITISTETGIIDHDAIAEDIIAGGAAAVYYIGRAINAGEVRARLGDDVPFVASVLGDVAAFSERAGDHAAGAIMPRQTAPPLVPGFTPSAAYAHDAITILLDALNAVAALDADGALTIDRAELRAAIRAYQGDGLTGALDCSDNGDCAAAAFDFLTVRDGELTEDDA